MKRIIFFMIVINFFSLHAGKKDKKNNEVYFRQHSDSFVYDYHKNNKLLPTKQRFEDFIQIIQLASKRDDDKLKELMQKILETNRSKSLKDLFHILLKSLIEDQNCSMVKYTFERLLEKNIRLSEDEYLLPIVLKMRCKDCLEHLLVYKHAYHKKNDKKP